MTNTEIKKALYKQKPTAKRTTIKEDVFFYETTIMNTDVSVTIKFEVPVTDMGDAEFIEEMEAKHLIRWIV
jgi:hypothetical protein